MLSLHLVCFLALPYLTNIFWDFSVFFAYEIYFDAIISSSPVGDVNKCVCVHVSEWFCFQTTVRVAKSHLGLTLASFLGYAVTA